MLLIYMGWLEDMTGNASNLSMSYSLSITLILIVIIIGLFIFLNKNPDIVRQGASLAML